MQFSLDGSGWMKSRRERHEAQDRGAQDRGAAARYELMSLRDLEAEAGPASLMAQSNTPLARVERLLAYSALLREIARRSGRVETLARAAAAAGRAIREAGSERTLKALSLLEHAHTLRLGAVLFGDEEAAIECAGTLDLIDGLSSSPVLAARVAALRARLAASAALAWNDAKQGLAAACTLDVAAAALQALGAPEHEVADVRIDRADLLIGLGARTHDRAVLQEAEAELHRLTHELDPMLLPLSWSRAEGLRGQALAALGEAAGDPASIAEAVAALTEALAELPRGHSPLDAARTGHALGVALQAMGEACDEEVLFDQAVDAFSPALEALDQVPALPFRAVAAHDGAACLARRAERRGDLVALEQAETVFRNALKARTAAADPLAWAVTQVALARIYEAQSGLRADTGERADAAFALAAALEVFTERGMRSLSDVALTALGRVKQAA